jgi:hypothetical protein
MKVHCVRCGNDFEIDAIHDDPLTQEQKDFAFKFCPFCHPGVMKFASEKGDEFVRKHIHPHIEPYKKREAKA